MSPGQPENVDLIVVARWVLPIEPAGAPLEDHAVVVDGGRIRAVLSATRARSEYAARRTVELPSHVVLPGLINLHTHAAMSLMRGLADDLPLMQWLKEHIWPAEGKHVSPDFVYDGTLLACAEMLRGGVTLFNDMYFFPEHAAQAVLDARMRAALGMICIEFPTAYASDAQDYLSKGLAVRDQFSAEPRLTFCLAPHAPYTVSDRSFEQIATYAAELDVPVHMHLHETEDEIREGMTRFGVRPLERMQRLGLLNPNLIAVHAVHLNDAEIALLAEHGASTVHCPSSNLKLASGVARLERFIEAGLNVGIGTDGAASNNRLDVFEEMRLAALLAKAQSGRANAVPAETALRMATLDAARALGLDHRIGSLAPGKEADMIAVELNGIALAPVYHPASHLVYAASRDDVSHVWVAGELLMENRRLTTLDESELLAKARSWQARIAEQA
ncbi:MAG: TRZ/ATZ family hydrolase [Proteobacteria bacterium]|nr:MAG: TRZ/ATZ family hydrolase [Pseudomonadota bacterium]